MVKDNRSLGADTCHLEAQSRASSLYALRARPAHLLLLRRDYLRRLEEVEDCKYNGKARGDIAPILREEVRYRFHNCTTFHSLGHLYFIDTFFSLEIVII